MQQAANAYSKIAQATHSPRELEAAVLMKAASRLQTIRDDWDGRQRELFEALTYNRKLWTILVSSATDAGNPLPAGDQAERRQSRHLHLQPYARGDDAAGPGAARRS